MKSLIFGIPGQDSWFLSKLLIGRGDEVTGCHRHTYLSDQFGDFDPELKLVYCDMMDRSSIDAVISSLKPDEVYNLAAHSFVTDSFEKPAQVISNNIVSHTNLLESVRHNSPTSKIYYSGSSEELDIKNPYGVSKNAIRHLNDIYRKSYGLFICHAQNFNHSSWRHSPQFLFPKVTKYVANLSTWLTKYNIIAKDGPIIQGQCIYGNANFSWLPKLELGDLSALRDISYAGDIMRAATMMMGQKESKVYTVSSGYIYSMDDIVRMCFEEFDLNYKDFIIQNDKLIRPSGLDNKKITGCKESSVPNYAPSVYMRELICYTIQEYIERGIK